MPPSVGSRHAGEYSHPCGGGAAASERPPSAGDGGLRIDLDEKSRRRVTRFGELCCAFYSGSISTVRQSVELARADGRHGRAAIEALDMILRHVDNDGDGNDRPSDGMDVGSGDERQKRREDSFRQSYRSFLSRNVAHVPALTQCGLGDPEFAVALLVGENAVTVREAFTSARDGARSAAHQSSMSERDSRLHGLLEEARAARTARKLENENPPFRRGPPSPASAPVASVVTTRRELQAIRSSVRQFVAAHGSGIGSHPLLAGMRRVIECQIDEGQKVVRWTFDSAAITEGCRVRDCGGGGSDRYVRDAVGMLTSFLVWVPEEYRTTMAANQETGKLWASGSPPPSSEGSCASLSRSALTFQVDTELSDRSLRKVLGALPQQKNLHARPTGDLEIFAEAMRTNIGGGRDELDFCNEFMGSVISRLKIFCPP